MEYPPGPRPPPPSPGPGLPPTASLASLDPPKAMALPRPGGRPRGRPQAPRNSWPLVGLRALGRTIMRDWICSHVSRQSAIRIRRFGQFCDPQLWPRGMALGRGKGVIKCYQKQIIKRKQKERTFPKLRSDM